MLFGYRGTEVVDVAAVEDLIARVAQLQHDLPAGLLARPVAGARRRRPLQRAHRAARGSTRSPTRAPTGSCAGCRRRSTTPSRAERGAVTSAHGFHQGPVPPRPAPGRGRAHQAPQRSPGRPAARRVRTGDRRRRLLRRRHPLRARGTHRLRPSLRAPDVPGLRLAREDGAHPLRRVLRRLAQRLDPPRLHQLLRGAARRRAGAGPVPRGRPDALTGGHRGEPRQPDRGGRGGDPGQRAQPAVRRVPVADAARRPVRHLPQRPRRVRRASPSSRARRSTTHATSSPTTTRRATPCSPSSGDLDPDETLALVERHFGDIPRRRVPARPDFAEPRAHHRSVGRSTSTSTRRRPAVALAWRVPDPADLAAYLPGAGARRRARLGRRVTAEPAAGADRPDRDRCREPRLVHGEPARRARPDGTRHRGAAPRGWRPRRGGPRGRRGDRAGGHRRRTGRRAPPGAWRVPRPGCTSWPTT